MSAPSHGGCFHPRCTGVSRRTFLSDMGMGFTGLVLANMLHGDPVARANDAGGWKPPTGQPHFPAKAKNVVWFMMRGGVSHVESFDPKPALNKYAGKTIDETPYAGVFKSPHFGKVREQVKNNIIDGAKAKLFPLQVGYRPSGKTGALISDWWPHMRECADDIALVRSMYTTDNNHGAQFQLLSGRHVLDGCFPTIGAWTHYGLGSLNENLPQFISLGPLLPLQFAGGLDSDYLGPEHAGVQIKVDPVNPLPYARPELDVSPEAQAAEAALLGKLNGLTAIEYPQDAALRARIKSYEIAFRMQTAVPEVMRFADETPLTLANYGVDNEVTRPFAEQCLAVRRFVERGVRFIQVIHGDTAAGIWDAHSNLRENHSTCCAQVDQPLAALIKDLKQRGLLDDTIVVWTSEFGRTPGGQGGTGRDHHNYGFSIWMAGGGIKPGVVHGATDEIGFHAVENRHYVTDIHATIFHLLGLDPRRLEIPGRKRLEIEYGRPIMEIMA